MEERRKRGGRDVEGGRRDMEVGIRELNWKVEEEWDVEVREGM